MSQGTDKAQLCHFGMRSPSLAAWAFRGSAWTLGTAEGPVSTSCSPGVLLWKPPPLQSGSRGAAGAQEPVPGLQGSARGGCLGAGAVLPASKHAQAGGCSPSIPPGHGRSNWPWCWIDFCVGHRRSLREFSVTVKINK